MDNWESYLHWSFRGERVLISSLRLESFSSFLVASLVAAGVCALERCVSRILEKRWEPRFVRRYRWQKVVWRTVFYWLATLLRLSYMLIAMSFHLGLLLVMVTTLTVSQTLIELYNSSSTQRNVNIEHTVTNIEEPLLNERSHVLRSIPTRPRSKSKPDAIFIHPNDSNLARADAVALDLGLSGDTDRVYGNKYERDGPAWTSGEGKGAARALLGASQKSSGDPFHVSNDSDSE